MVIVRTIGIQKERAQAHNLDIANLAAVRAPDESFGPDEDFMEELAEAACVGEGGVDPAEKSGVCAGVLVGYPSEVDPRGTDQCGRERSC